MELTPEKLKEIWNSIPDIRICRQLTGPTLKSVQLRIKEHPSEEWWRNYFTIIQASDFLMGKKVDFQASLG